MKQLSPLFDKKGRTLKISTWILAVSVLMLASVEKASASGFYCVSQYLKDSQGEFFREFWSEPSCQLAAREVNRSGHFCVLQYLYNESNEPVQRFGSEQQCHESIESDPTTPTIGVYCVANYLKRDTEVLETFWSAEACKVAAKEARATGLYCLFQHLKNLAGEFVQRFPSEFLCHQALE